MLHIIGVRVCVCAHKCRTVQHPISLVPEKKKNMMPGQARYRIKPWQSSIFLVRYQTDIIDADADDDAGVSFLDADAQLCI